MPQSSKAFSCKSTNTHIKNEGNIEEKIATNKSLKVIGDLQLDNEVSLINEIRVESLLEEMPMDNRSVKVDNIKSAIALNDQSSLSSAYLSLEIPKKGEDTSNLNTLIEATKYKEVVISTFDTCHIEVQDKREMHTALQQSHDLVDITKENIDEQKNSKGEKKDRGDHLVL